MVDAEQRRVTDVLVGRISGLVAGASWFKREGSGGKGQGQALPRCTAERRGAVISNMHSAEERKGPLLECEPDAALALIVWTGAWAAKCLVLGGSW